MKTLLVICITWTILGAIINFFNAMKDDIGVTARLIYAVGTFLQIAVTWFLWHVV